MNSCKKLKILAIHGYRQSDKSFSGKLGSLRKSFKKEVEFVFAKAPHHVPPIEHLSEENETEVASDTEQLGWWFNTEDQYFKATEPSNLSVGFEESLKYIESIFEEQGPFDGLIGFSQDKFKFAILISGFKSLCAPHNKYYDQEISLPTLHVYGSGDQIIPTQMCEELSDLFTNKQVFLHEGGHYVPGKKHIYHDFLKNMSEKFVDK